MLIDDAVDDGFWGETNVIVGERVDGGESVRTALVDEEHVPSSCWIGNAVDGLYTFAAGNVYDFREIVRM